MHFDSKKNDVVVYVMKKSIATACPAGNRDLKMRVKLKRMREKKNKLK